MFTSEVSFNLNNMNSHLAEVTQNGGWKPGIGDPTVVGWLITVAYIVTSVLCARRALIARQKSDRKQLIFWTAVTVLFVLLAINKQLDFQVFLGAVARNISMQQGWYENRQIFRIFTGVIIATSGMFSIVFAAKMMRENGENLLTFIGLGLLLIFIVVRAASYHSVDVFLAKEIAGQKLRYLLELAAIICIAVSAAKPFIFEESD